MTFQLSPEDDPETVFFHMSTNADGKMVFVIAYVFIEQYMRSKSTSALDATSQAQGSFGASIAMGGAF